MHTCRDDGDGDEDAGDSKGHDGEEVVEELLLLHLEAGVEDDGREHVDEEELLVEPEDPGVLPLAHQEDEAPHHAALQR